jgi:hypothetical protein
MVYHYSTPPNEKCGLGPMNAIRGSIAEVECLVYAELFIYSLDLVPNSEEYNFVPAFGC